MSHENIIQKPPIDILFENLFEEELMCLDEPTRDHLIKYTFPGESVDLSFEEIYETELEFLSIHSEKVPTEKCGGDQFLNNECRNMRRKNLKKLTLGRKRAKMTEKLASLLCPIKRTVIPRSRNTYLVAYSDFPIVFFQFVSCICFAL